MFQPSGNSFNQTLSRSTELVLSPISYAEPSRWPRSAWRGAAKRAIDIVVAMFLLTLFSPVMLLAALAIHLESPGPCLFRQRRIGLANADFEMLKFRTMRNHAQDPGQFTQTTRNDPRVTRVGAFLRQTSLDELPQFINVLRGEMSLVGPRPHAPGTCAGGTPFELVTPHYPARHRVQPGMTGLAQVRGWRGETDTEEKLLGRVAADLEYIDNWSLWLDFGILVRTGLSVLIMRNAY
jgi:exopolysaccharide biosynthesis polyprenyl glycosylphosphotransferase